MLDPAFDFGYTMRALIKVWTGDTRGAQTDVQTALRYAEDRFFAEAAAAVVDAGLGDTASARARAKALAEEFPDQEPIPPRAGIFLARAFLATGDDESALHTLERVRPLGVHLIRGVDSPDFDVIRDDPRFQQILADARSPEQSP